MKPLHPEVMEFALTIIAGQLFKSEIPVDKGGYIVTSLEFCNSGPYISTDKNNPNYILSVSNKDGAQSVSAKLSEKYKINGCGGEPKFVHYNIATNESYLILSEEQLKELFPEGKSDYIVDFEIRAESPRPSPRP